MSDSPSEASPSTWLVGDSEVIGLIRAKNWAETPLGSLEQWSESLRTTVSLVLASSFPINLVWGEGAVQIWNDAYSGVCGDKHPSMFGSDYRVCWASAWPAIGGAFDAARAGSTAFLENQPMFLDRHGFLEETWFTFSLSPIRGEDGEIAGLFHPVTETTPRMLAERRAKLLRDLASATSTVQTAKEALDAAIEVLAAAAHDVPAALVYLLDDDGVRANLRGSTGIAVGGPVSPAALAADGESFVAKVISTGQPIQVEGLSELVGPVHGATYPEPLERLLVLPIITPGQDRAGGALVLAFSPRLQPDDTYRGFLELVAQGVTRALTSSQAREHEQARAEALVELDRAKTEFFANVSHEFRTPLTLILGPLEEQLRAATLDPESTSRLSMAHRNGQRLLHLVNSLLDFSRAQSGVGRAQFAPTDLAEVTAGLAAAFADAMRTADLEFIVECPPLPELIYVDQGMWERIVLNLLSNALKHTFTGRVSLTLHWRGDHVELEVADSGVGIEAEELPRLFERFHRVRATQARSIEGTGIGLALVKELAELHGGAVTVDSDFGIGSRFVVTIGAGHEHLPADQVLHAPTQEPTGSAARAHADQAVSWLRSASEVQVPVLITQRGPEERRRAQILLADDNADMRVYLTSLLRDFYDVVPAVNGADALAAALAHPPDLVLTDVMMPELDGFGLLRALQEDVRTRTIPVIMLSARAGQEASVAGIRAGVDDYLAKPFTSEELLARVSRSLELAAVRREAEAQLRAANARLTVMATTDPGTGLPNRRHWDELLPAEIARAHRRPHPVCIAVVDLDNLKTFNDTFGHAAGDTLLRGCATAWRTALRATDSIARIGGDEFAVLMPEADIDQARVVIERLRAATPHGQTCSAGVARWDGSETAARLIARADTALYQAKRDGRAQTVTR